MCTDLRCTCRSSSEVAAIASDEAGSTTQHLQFRGIINTSGGGFASCRGASDGGGTDWIPEHVTSFKVRVRGDGQRYKMTLQTVETVPQRTIFQQDFDTPDGQLVDLVLPLSRFSLASRGTPVASAPPVPTEIVGVGFMLSLLTSDGQPNPCFRDGPFVLDVHDITAGTESHAHAK